jgi:hypothetical protein
VSASPASSASTTQIAPQPAPIAPGPSPGQPPAEQDLTFRLALPLVLGGALAIIVFGARGGTELTRTTLAELFMLVVAGGVVMAGLLVGRRGPLYGGSALAFFVALAALTAVSVTWAIAPGLAYVEAGRTLAYLALFAAAIAGARLAPNAASVAIKGVLIAAMTAVAYALIARVWPESIGSLEISNRIGQPFEYWNAVGTTAALVLPGLLWLAARREGSLVGRVLAYPAVGAAVLAILLTQSRGALVAALIGVGLWLAIVPLRLRSLPVIVLPAIVGGAVAAWALSKDAFAESGTSLAAKESVGGTFGLLLLLMVVLLLGAGVGVHFARRRFTPSQKLRRRVGIAGIAVACAIPLLGMAALATSDRSIGDRIDEFTSETDTAPDQQGAGRFTAASSTRGKYWREAGRIFGDRPSVGLGAGTFGVARLRHRTDSSVTHHAHGFVAQTMADLGIVGLVVTTGLLVAWLAAALRATALVPRRLRFWKRDDARPGVPWTDERIALVALALIAFAFGVQSIVDWTWFIPGPMAMALVAAGFVAGRGPLARPLEDNAPARPSAAGPLRLAAAAALLVCTLVAMWAVWQPEQADRDVGEALELADAGQTDAAIAKTFDAADANPLSPDPLLIRAVIAADARRENVARETLEQAVLEFPGYPQTWHRLAAFQLTHMDDPDKALLTVRGALYLDPESFSHRRLYLDALAQQRVRAVAP